MNNIQIREYFASLKLLRLYLGVNPARRCDEWLALYSKIQTTPSSWGPAELPILLALVHPDFYHDRRGENIGEQFLYPHSKRSFPDNKRWVQQCGISDLIDGAICPYWRGEKLRSDHLWPHSLGGATSSENRLSLCEKCNLQKSNSPLLYPGSWVPGWLRNRVELMKEVKERTWD